MQQVRDVNLKMDLEALLIEGVEECLKNGCFETIHANEKMKLVKGDTCC